MKDDSMEEHDVVRVVKFLKSGRPFSGSEGQAREPRIGDLAAIVHVLQPEKVFVLEAVDADGRTVWLADFCAEELALETKCHAKL